MVQTFYFIRHGQTDQNKQLLIQGQGDFPLNEEGKNQAKECSAKLKGISFDKAYSSPLSRALSTAKIILDNLGQAIEVTPLPGFIERDFGEAEGKDVKSAIFDDVISGKCKGAEKNSHLEKRVNDTFLSLLKNNSENVLVVAHAHVIKALLISLNYSDFNYYSKLVNSSVTIIKNSDGKITIEAVNK